MGESAALLLGPAARRDDSASVHGGVQLRLRVHGPQRTACHHPPHGQDHAHYHTGQQLCSPGERCEVNRFNVMSTCEGQ